MSTPSPPAPLPDAVVRAIRCVSRPFAALQFSRYGTATSTADRSTTMSLVMCTKTALSQHGDGQLDTRNVLPSTWAELYRGAVKELPDAPSQRLWGLVSTVLSLLEQGGTADGVNASAAIVAWADRFHTATGDMNALVADLLRCSPLQLDEAVVDDIGAEALRHLEDAFLAGHFETAAALINGLLTFLRHGNSRLLSAEVEAALADVRRLLTTAFHDSDSHQNAWVATANALLREWRNTLVFPADSLEKNQRRVMDALVEDLCATCLDVLILITEDAMQLQQRCREAGRSAVDFLVAMCAIMEPYAELPRVAAIFAEFVQEWSSEEEEEEEGKEDGTHQWWYYEAVQAVLEARSMAGMVDAMESVARISLTACRQAEAAATGRGSGDQPGRIHNLNNSSDDDDGDDGDAVSDTVDLEEVATSVSASALIPSHTRRFLLACMTAHVADLCAPAVAAPYAAEMYLTFARNDLVTAYAELFAFDARTWRVAGMYACYSPLINPRFLANVTEAAAPMALADESVYYSLLGFFRSSWSIHSDHQLAVRAKLEAVLPGNATVAQWWAAMDFSHAEAYRKVHRYLVVTLLNRKQWARAAWLAVETGLTDTLQSHLRHILASADALASEELYAIGCAVQRAFVAVRSSSGASVELARYLCAAASLASYRRAATTANAALSHASDAQTGIVSAAVADAAATATVACLQVIEAALKCTNECDVVLHPSTTFTLVEHGASLLLSLRQLMRDPVTGDTTDSIHVSSCVLPLLMEAYQLSSIHFGRTDPALARRSRTLGEKLAHVHQICV